MNVNCPQVVVQGGSYMHCMNDKNMIGFGSGNIRENAEEDNMTNNREITNQDYANQTNNVGPEYAKQYTIPLKLRDKSTSGGHTMQSSTNEHPVNRDFLDQTSGLKSVSEKFSRGDSTRDYEFLLKSRSQSYKSVLVNNVPLTELTIGGYRDDEADVRDDVLKVIPLPPVSLPIIFIDKDLNFLHQFFAGIAMCIGTDKLLLIVSKDTHYHTDDTWLTEVMKQLITEPYMGSDSQIHLYLKTIMRSTFGIPDAKDNPNSVPFIWVRSNNWGLQYISPDLRCYEAELNMWLAMNYLEYRKVWFNNFKSCGVPEFAKSGVQSRWLEAPPPKQVDTKVYNITSPVTELNASFVNPEKRHRRKKSPTQSIQQEPEMKLSSRRFGFI